MRKVFVTIVFLIVMGLAGSAYSQCRTMDKNVERPLKVVRGTPTVVRDTIRLCTSHVFRFRAARGRQLSLKLATGKKTSLTLMPPSGEALVDGGLTWSGRLTESGQYEIQIGTDATARYTLEITIN
jgi:hypothetical protein